MSNKIKKRLSRIKSKFLYKSLPKIVDWLVKLCAFTAKNRISKGERFDLLIDNTVVGHSVTHDSVWIKTVWDEELQLEYGYSARIPVHDEKDTSIAARSIRYLPAIYSLAKSELISIYTSYELQQERIHHPVGRYGGYAMFSYSLFTDVPVKPSDETSGFENNMNFDSNFPPNLEEAKKQKKIRFSAYTNPLYLDLVNVLGQSNDQDAYHIFIAQKKGLYCFLTMDFRLI